MDRITCWTPIPRPFPTGSISFSYTASGTKDRYTVVISYPDGTSYVWEQSDGSGSGGWRAGLEDEYQYDVDGSTLCDLVAMTLPNPPNYGRIIIAVILAGLGIFNIIRLRTAWFFGQRLECMRTAEPSDMALSAHVIGGILALVIAVIVFMSAFA